MTMKATLSEIRKTPEWHSMETAPRDGTPIQARIPGNGSDNIIMWLDCFIDAEDQDSCGWAFVHEDQEPPQCWTDGACWSSNENNEQSVQPIAWKPVQ